MNIIRSGLAIAACLLVLRGRCADVQPAGWLVRADLAAARTSAGAEWVRKRVLGRLLEREVLPGYRADDLWERGSRCVLLASADGAWSHAAWTVEGDWSPDLHAALSALPAAGAEKAVFCFAPPLPELERDRLPAAGLAPDPALSVRARRDTQVGRPLYVARDGNRLRFASSVARLSDLSGRFSGQSAVGVAAASGWLAASWSPATPTGGFRRIEVTLRDSSEGALRAEIRLVAVDAAAAEQGSRGIAGLLRMLENINDDRVTSRVRDSLKVLTEGTTVTAGFEVPAEAFGGLCDEPTHGAATGAR